jgi:hypothetical protein
MAANEAGLRINDVFYPLPESFKIGEARVIRQMTGMNLQAFAESLSRLDKELNPDVYAAWVWVAMHRQNPPPARSNGSSDVSKTTAVSSSDPTLAASGADGSDIYSDYAQPT